MRVAAFKRDRLVEHRTSVDARVELAPLAAGIDVGRKVAQQKTIEFSPGKRGIEAPRVDAGEPRAQTAIDHLLRELTGWNPPDGEERLEAGPRKLLFSIAANVLEEQIANAACVNPFAVASAIATRIFAS